MTPNTIANLLQPYLAAVPEPPVGWPHITVQLLIYLQLILKWNARTNLTAIRSPEDIVRRHFGESLFTAAKLGPTPTLLDFGSGAGFPGIPIQLFRPDIHVTLAESQGKKASFLREVVRSLALPTEVWADRVELMPESCQFHTVTLRAVDHMDAAIREASQRATDCILILGTSRKSIYPSLSNHFQMAESIALPETNDGVLLTANRTST